MTVSDSELRKAFSDLHIGLENDLEFEAHTGIYSSDGITWITDVPGRPGFWWVRRDSDGLEKACFNDAASKPDQPVICRWDTKTGIPTIVRVHNEKSAVYNPTTPPVSVPPIPTGINSGREQYNPAALISDGLVFARSGMTVGINPFAAVYQQSQNTYTPPDTDLTSYIPGSASTHCWVLIGYDPVTNAVQVVTSTPIAVSMPLLQAQIAAISFANYIPLAAVQLINGQTILQFPGQFVDRRPWITGQWWTMPLGVTWGGTGLATLPANLLLAGNGTNPLQSVTNGTAGQPLLATAGLPAYGALNLAGGATIVTGIAPVTNGGTGAAALTAHALVVGNGTSAVNALAPGSARNVAISDGTDWTSRTLIAADTPLVLPLVGGTLTGPVIFTPQATPSTTEGKVYYDSTAHALEYYNGSAWVSLTADTGITQLTGDVTAGPGSGSQAATLATVNSNVGVFAIATVTANAKGLITAVSAASTTGSGSVVLATSPTIVTPTIADFTNATHTHQNNAGGGTLDAAAIASGTLNNARVNWAAPGTLGSTTPNTVAATNVTITGGGYIAPSANSTSAIIFTKADTTTAVVTIDTTTPKVIITGATGTVGLALSGTGLGLDNTQRIFMKNASGTSLTAIVSDSSNNWAFRGIGGNIIFQSVSANQLVVIADNGLITIRNTTASTGITRLLIQSGAGQSGTALLQIVDATANTFFNISSGGVQTNTAFDAGTNAVVNVATFGHNTSNTPVANYGTGVLLTAQDNNTANTNIARWRAFWNAAVHTSQAATVVLSAYGTAEQDAITIKTTSGGTIPLVGFGTVSSPTAYLHLPAGTTAASGSPLKFNSGTSMTSAEAGAVEFTTDDLFFTITTGTARKRVLFADPSGGLTSGRVPYNTANGRLTDTSGFTFDGTTLTTSKLALTAGSGSGAPKVGGSLFAHHADVGNTTILGADDDLYSDTIPASTLATNDDLLEAQYGGTFVSSATATREVKVWFGGTAVFDTGALTLSLSSAWTAYVTIIRVSATVVRYMISFTTEGAALAAYTAVGELTGLTLSNTNILKITGAAAGVGAAANDIVAKLATVAWYPAP